MTLALEVSHKVVYDECITIQGLHTGQCPVAFMSLGVFVFLRNSVKYNQHTMEEALRRVNLMQADLGGTEILRPLKTIYGASSIPGHPLQVRIAAELIERE